MRADLFYTATLAFALGILLQSLVVFSEAIIVWLCFLSLVLALLWRGRSCDASVRPVLLLSVGLLTCSLGAVRLQVADEAMAVPLFAGQVGGEVSVEGVVVREPDEREKSTQLYVQVEDELLLVRTDRYAGISYGDRVRVMGELEVPEPFETGLGRTFNYPGYLKAQGVTHLVSFSDVEVLASGEGNLVIEKLLTLKHLFINRLELVLSEPYAGLAEGLLLGVKGGLGEELEQVFRATGIIHIVVLSGYNVMLVVTFVLYGLAFVLPHRGRLVFGLCAIAAFAVLVGLSATVVRASIMAALLLVARFLSRSYAIMRALTVAGVSMLLLNPYLIAYDVGFQLSFLATLGLVLLAPWLQNRLERVPNGFLKTREFLTATITAQIFVTPLLLYQIGQFSVVSVLVNVIVLPMVPVAMLLTFMTGIVAVVYEPLATVLAYPTYLSLSYIISCAEWFAALPFASFTVPEFPLPFVALSYLTLGYVAYRLSRAGTEIAPELTEELASERNTIDASEWTIVEQSDVQLEMAFKMKDRSGTGVVLPVPADTSSVPVLFR